MTELTVGQKEVIEEVLNLVRLNEEISEKIQRRRGVIRAIKNENSECLKECRYLYLPHVEKIKQLKCLMYENRSLIYKILAERMTLLEVEEIIEINGTNS